MPGSQAGTASTRRQSILTSSLVTLPGTRQPLTPLRRPLTAGLTCSARDDEHVDDHLRCRLNISGGELELAGSPDELRALARLLRDAPDVCRLTIRNGLVLQVKSEGVLTVRQQEGPVLRLSGDDTHLDIVWSALEGVAEAADIATDHQVKRHQHIEHFPGDVYRSPHSQPLIVTADWPQTR